MVERKEIKLPEEEQKSWSTGLIFGITIVTLIYLWSTPVEENVALIYIVMIAPVLTILTGGYIYVYRGQKSRTARVIFTLLLLISLVVFFGIYYLVQLGNAYRN